MPFEKGRSTSSASGRSGQEVRRLHLQCGRYLLQSACPHSVGALLIFLHLLKRHANGFAKSLLGLVHPDPPRANPTADFNINEVDFPLFPSW